MKPELIKFVAGTKAKASEINENFDKLLNHVIETEENDVRVYKPDQEFEYGKYVLGEVDGIFGIYKSVAEENKGNPLTDENYWVKVDLLEEFDLGYYLNKSQITNCITEIPQRIKLELNNGTLTLKAGSEVIVPNGKNADESLKFDYVVVNNDLIAEGDYPRVAMTFLSPAHTSIESPIWVDYCFSGDIAPNNFYDNKYAVWYDTANNIVKLTRNGGSTWVSGYSLPLCITTETATSYASIDQIFNGFGYIGSTVWVDKGVKGLIPNGRNEDGSLKNIEVTTTSISMQTFTTNTITLGNGRIVIYSNGNIGGRIGTYDFVNNYNLASDGVTKITAVTVAENCIIENGIIKEMNFKQPFRAVDYNDFANTPHIIQTYENGTSGYEVYSNGKCKQWGRMSAGQNISVTYLKKYINQDYTLSYSPVNTTNNDYWVADFCIHSFSETGFVASNNTGITAFWQAYGYIN